MAENKKKQEQQEAAIVKAEPVGVVTPPQYSASPEKEQGAGSILDRLQRRREEAAANARDAGRRWRQAYSQTGVVMAGFAPKPKDTTVDQNRLRRAAIAQAFGELVGTIGQGIVASGRGGEGYVTAPLGMYNHTMQQLQRLKEQDLASRQDYANLMARLRMQNEADRVRLLEKEADRATAEVNAYDKMLTEYELLQQKQRAEAQQKAEQREHEAEQKRLDRENAIKAAEIRATSSNKGKKAADTLDGDEKLILSTILPKERVVKRRDEAGKEYTTTQPYASYPEEQVEAAAIAAKELKKLGVSPEEVNSIMSLIRQYDSLKSKGDEVIDIYGVLLGLKSGDSVEEVMKDLKSAIQSVKTTNDTKKSAIPSVKTTDNTKKTAK